MLDAYTITPRQIADLRNEAREVGDSVMVEWCDIALSRFHLTYSNGQRMPATRDEARAVCAAAINAATAAAG